METKKFYVTTPIYYVNDRPHIGHAYTTVLADVLARYHRLLGAPTFFLTGSDEHGQKIHKAAQAAGISPQEHVDRTVVRFQELWRKLSITSDDFIRTTEERHRATVQRILQDLFERDEIYKAEYDGWYCVPCERFFTAKDIVGGNCPDCGRPVEQIKEANYFFRMSRYQDWLVRYLQDHPGFIQPDYRRNETLGFLRKPLGDLCISRPKNRLAWGIDLPFDSNYVTYVWFDALVNYISAVGYGRDEALFARWWPASCHLIGKDILTTHTVYWPTMLKAMNLPMPDMIFAHGWWLMGQTKMSKSLGNVINPLDIVDRHGADAFRYFLMAEMALGQDAGFSADAFTRRYNADLANDLGNLLNRVLNMIGRYCGGAIPAPAADAPGNPAEAALWQSATAAALDLPAMLAGMKLQEWLGQVLAVVKGINRYLEEKQPWTLARQADRQPLFTTLYTAAETLRLVSILLHPVMPGKMEALRRALGMENASPDFHRLAEWGQIPPGCRVTEPGPLFPRIVEAEPAPEPAAPSTPVPAAGAPTAGAGDLIAYEDFARVQLRTAQVLSAAKVPETNKLLRLEVQVGAERRQLVAGIAQHYEPEQLVGKTVILVANLKPAKIRGIESQGMILAASAGDRMRLVTVDGEMPGGAVVK